MKLIATVARRRHPAALHFVLAQLSYVAGFCILFAAGIAFAQEPAPGSAEPDLVGLLAAVLKAVENGEWWLAAGPALTLAVMALRRWDQDIPRIGPSLSKFMDQPAVSFVLPSVLSGLTGLFGALATGTPIGAALLAALKVSMAAIVTYVGAKKVAEQAKGAGAAEAAKVDSGQAAVDVLNKGG